LTLHLGITVCFDASLSFVGSFVAFNQTERSLPPSVAVYDGVPSLAATIDQYTVITPPSESWWTMFDTDQVLVIAILLSP
jgi:hypothetical protein